jgi:glycosyltransferase involved in cell wall biosynthesis
MNDYPLVTIIIPTYNSSQYLEKTLITIKQQTYPNIEVIIVDKGSIDNTWEIAKKFNFKFYRIEARERCSQLNFAINAAHGEYIYRIDSDFVLESDIVEIAVNLMQSEKYDALVIHNTSDARISYWAKIRKVERDCYKNDEINVAARFYRKNVLIDLGCFDEDLVASEDYDLHNRTIINGYKIGYISHGETHQGEPCTLGEIARKHYYYGKTIKSFLSKNKKRGYIQLNPIRISHIKNYKSFIDERIFFGFIIYQIVRYGSAFIGYSVSIFQLGQKRTISK